eukprot:g59505.t1
MIFLADTCVDNLITLLTLHQSLLVQTCKVHKNSVAWQFQTWADRGCDMLYIFCIGHMRKGYTASDSPCTGLNCNRPL